MSTRGIIAIENGDKSCRGIYVHFDMYPDGAGVCLTNHYTTKERVEALLALGDLSSLGDRLSEDDPEPNAVDTCSAYHRDYGETLTEARVFKNAEEIQNTAWDRFGAEYIYLFRDGAWYVSNAYISGPFGLVTTLLENPEDE